MAKKRYKQNAKDRLAESRGMEHMFMKEMKERDYYAGMDPRRRLEYQDSMMISEDPRAIANLPQEVKYHEYPKSPYAGRSSLDDTLRGVDKQIGDDMREKKKDMYPEKY